MTVADQKGIAVVTGASSGIGAAYATKFAMRGHPLLLVARRADRLEVMAAELSSEYGVKVEFVIADLEQHSDLVALEQKLESETISILVNNAGAGRLGATAKSSADNQESLIKLNVVSLTRLSLAALASFRKRGTGTLINIGSIIACAPNAMGATYSATKAFVLNFTQSLALEYAATDIRIQVVMPGPIRTEFFSSQGLSDSIFPDKSFLTADQLVDAALAGLELGEVVTNPAVADVEIWDNIETARNNYLAASSSGKVAPRYLK